MSTDDAYFSHSPTRYENDAKQARLQLTLLSVAWVVILALLLAVVFSPRACS